MLHPDEFRINEAWIAFRINEAPVSTEADGDFNVIALMDASSCFILSSEFVPATSSEPSQLEARRLIENAKSHKQQLPETFYIPENLTADILCMEVERNGIAVNRIPEKQLLVLIGEARDYFKEYMGGDSVQ